MKNVNIWVEHFTKIDALIYLTREFPKKFQQKL